MTRKMANYNQVKVLTDSICEKLNITDEDEIQDAYVVAMECIKKYPDYGDLYTKKIIFFRINQYVVKKRKPNYTNIINDIGYNMDDTMYKAHYQQIIKNILPAVIKNATTERSYEFTKIFFEMAEYYGIYLEKDILKYLHNQPLPKTICVILTMYTMGRDFTCEEIARWYNTSKCRVQQMKEKGLRQFRSTFYRLHINVNDIFE